MSFKSQMYRRVGEEIEDAVSKGLPAVMLGKLATTVVLQILFESVKILGLAYLPKGMGSLSLVERKPTRRRHPGTGEVIDIHPAPFIHWKLGTRLGE